MESGQGAGGIGYAFPAALGAATASADRVFAISGHGSSMYSISELASAHQHQLPVTWIVIDDGGYGTLCEYMTGAFDKATATELSRPNFVA
ncbi:thiamine pyrophosphate-dependent enzyme [Auritidibacter sp. NML100628]|uniref:thiamine pyrophosphate-dependent enzyme n=1 Tax=Auritidibacter sp. NML100628 TaxID=2170742 RepID=UPI0035143460